MIEREKYLGKLSEVFLGTSYIVLKYFVDLKSFQSQMVKTENLARFVCDYSHKDITILTL